jgi:hypothetical protein
MINKRSFCGDLSLLSAVNLFQLIGLASLSGQLKMRCAENSIIFIFTGGRLNYALSREGHKKIGRILVESHLMTTEQLRTCLVEQKSAKKWRRLGTIAVKNGYIQNSQITDIFFTQLKTAFFEAITWEEGRFEFVDTVPLTDEDIVLEENVEPLIMQALFLMDGGGVN